MANGEIQTLDPVRVTPESSAGGNMMGNLLNAGQAFIERFGDQPHVKKALKQFKKQVSNQLVPELKNNELTFNEESIKEKIEQGKEILSSGIYDAFKKEGTERIGGVVDEVLTKDNAAMLTGGVVSGIIQDSINKQLGVSNHLSGFQVDIGTPQGGEHSKGIAQDVFYGSEIMYTNPNLLGVSLTANPQLLGNDRQSYQIGAQASFNSPMDIINMVTKGETLPSRGKVGVEYKYSPDGGHSGVIKFNK